MSTADDEELARLRLRAEAVAQHGLSDESRDDRFLSLEESKKALQELRVHQIELEMQNETLRDLQGQLEASRDRYLDLYDFAPVGYLTLTIHGMIDEINLTAATLLGVNRKNLLRRGFSSLVVAEEQGRWTQHFLRVMEQDGKGSVELTLRRSDDTVFAALLDCRRTEVVAGDAAVRIALTDISERKQLEAELAQHRDHLEQRVFARTAELAAAKDAAEAANSAKGTFLANMSHELRTPMSGVVGMIGMVLQRATDPKQIDWLNKSKLSAQHLLSVLNDILDISQIESERLTLDESNFSLTQTIDQALQMQDAAAQAKGLRLSREVSPALPDLLRGDATRLRQILTNFTSNAIKFSTHGQITVRASALEEDSHSLLLKIEVSDQGIGISPEQQARLFRAFTQADSSMTRKYGGSGLGLIIAKRIALLMSGDAGVSSEAGVGSTFWATARLKRAVAGKEADSRLPLEPARDILQRQFAGVRVLVAEDDAVCQEIAKALLEEAGLVPEVVPDGLEALEKARRGGYALILLDIQMPMMNALDATRAIRQLPGMAAIPILAMTANAFDQDRDACMAAGMNAHISKPTDEDAFYATALEWLRKSDEVAPA